MPTEPQPPPPWSNEACLGFAELAAERIGVDRELIRELIRAMQAEFEFTSLEDAARHHNFSTY